MAVSASYQLLQLKAFVPIKLKNYSSLAGFKRHYGLLKMAQQFSSTQKCQNTKIFSPHILGRKKPCA